MPNGTFEDFLDALRAFESGWDRPRYEAGVIQDWQLDEWAGGPVTDFYQGYSSWGDLTDAEWDAMSYMSTNSLGFVGYQFGEALLIDLGYYDDDQFYGNGASTNTWDGTWTGKNGVTSLADFMTAEAQDVAIREAFGHNLKIIESQLSASGESLSDYIGQTISYDDNGVQVSVELTLTGILAASHLRGAFGLVSLLQGGSVSTDEYGTSILQYIQQFGGYDAPSISDAIAFYEDRLTGDEGLGTPGDPVGPETGDNSGGALDNPEITAETADAVVTWAWGQNIVISDFDPAMDTLFFDWFTAEQLEFSESGGSLTITIASNNQTVTLTGVTFAQLVAGNIHMQDATARAELGALLSQDSGDSDPIDPDPVDPDPIDPDPVDPDPVDPDPVDPDPVDPDPVDPTGVEPDSLNNPDISSATADVVVTWAWGQDRVVTDFNPAMNTLFFDWFTADQLAFSEDDGSLTVTMAGNNQSLTLVGVSLAELVAENIHLQDAGARAELAALLSGKETHPDDPHDHQMVMISLTSISQTIDGFNPGTDMVHVGGGVTGDQFEIFEESGDALGLTTRITVTEPDGTVLSTTILIGVGLADLTLANFSVAEQSAQNEVASAIGAVITVPTTGDGYDVTYDSDGSSPPTTTGTTQTGGVKYRADTNADDIVGFDVATDQLDFGATSVHNMIITKTAAGEIAIDTPWSDDLQIVQGVGYDDVTIESFGVVGNEHLRQDLGGVVSWEQGVGPRDADTVYVRSHEYGVHETISNFNPDTMFLSFLYFGTRERLTVEDTTEGLMISSLPTGQSLLLTGVELSDLDPARVQFHNDQVVEDNLEVPFGFAQEEVSLVDRTLLLTPEAPDGATTDGFQVRDMVAGETGGTDPNPEPPVADDTVTLNAGVDEVSLTWNWGVKTTYVGFDPTQDTINFNSFADDHLEVSEVNGNLLIEVLEQNGNITTFQNIQAEDLSMANLTAEDWNTLLDDDSGLIQALQNLGFEFV